MPLKGLKGICPGCGKEVIAKCGRIKLHHWAHRALKDCDPWWESETQWHRDWKSLFPENYREVIFTDANTGEFHRADIHTSKDVTIEFQNSPISLEELKSREAFYKKLIWVINAKKFKGFEFAANIPDPYSTELSDYEFGMSRYPVFFLLKEVQSGSTLLQVFGLSAPELQHIKTCPIMFLFEWKRPHQAWYLSEAPIFLDFGDSVLFMLKKKIQTSNTLWYLHAVSKKEFVAKYSS